MLEPKDSLQALSTKLQAFVTLRQWAIFHSPKNLSMALSVEVGELLEHFQWLSEQDSIQLDEPRRQAVAMECADVLLYLLQLSNKLQIDLVQSAHEKLRINEIKYPIEKSKGRATKYNQL